MADITGSVGTGNITQSLRLPDVADTVLQLEPNVTPLTVLTARLGTESCHNPEYSWHENSLKPRFDTVNFGGGYNSSATGIVVTNIAYFAQYDLVKNTATGEVMQVTAVNSGTSTATVARGIGGGAAAIANGAELLIVGGAQPEGDTSKPARSRNPVKVTNYCQIHTTPYDSTRTMRASATYTRPSNWNRLKTESSMEFKKDWEYTFWHGRPSEDLTGSQPKRTTGGVFYYLTANQTDMGGTMTEAEFFGSYSATFRYGSQDTKTLFASRLFVDVINGYPRGKLESIQSDSDKTYGLNVRRFVSPHGVLNVITHNLLEGSKFGGVGVVLDIGLLKRRVIRSDEENGEIRDEDNIQENDRDGKKGQWKAEQGFQMAQAQAHAYMYNVTG